MAESKRVQIGWMNPTTGVMCDCPVYELSPHANSVPVYAEYRDDWTHRSVHPVFETKGKP